RRTPPCSTSFTKSAKPPRACEKARVSDWRSRSVWWSNTADASSSKASPEKEVASHSAFLFGAIKQQERENEDRSGSRRQSHRAGIGADRAREQRLSGGGGERWTRRVAAGAADSSRSGNSRSPHARAGWVRRRAGATP